MPSDYMDKYVNTLYDDGVTIRGSYYLEVRVYRDQKKYEITIYDATRSTAGFAWRHWNPAIIGPLNIDINSDLETSVIRLINEWEKPIIDEERLREWDGFVLPAIEDEPEPEPSQQIVTVPGTPKKQRFEIFDWSDPDDMRRKKLLEQKKAK